MKTAEQIAGSHSLSTCRNCDCALANGGVCKRIVGLLNEAIGQRLPMGVLVDTTSGRVEVEGNTFIQCNHSNTEIGWDEVRCRGCGMVKPGAMAYRDRKAEGLLPPRWFKSWWHFERFCETGKTPETD